MDETSQAQKLPDDAPVPSDALSSDTSSRFPIIGIGASAGGLSAFESFFSTMPPDRDPGIAFVLVQHLARDHKSILSDLIRRCTAMKVFDVQDGMVVKPNCAYIIPPNRDMELVRGSLRLLEPTLARGIRLPIDFFFRSLAQDQREHAICIVLSGTGSDGALGVRAVKGEGGMVMAQAPETTEYDGMPRSAIATGMVDFVLPPHEMPAKLLAYVAHAFGPSLVSNAPSASEPGDPFEKIFSIRRRVERRMAVHQIARLEDYLRFLKLTPPEVDALFRALLIGVTNFFRHSNALWRFSSSPFPSGFPDAPPAKKPAPWPFSSANAWMRSRQSSRSTSSPQTLIGIPFTTPAPPSTRLAGQRAAKVARREDHLASIRQRSHDEALAPQQIRRLAKDRRILPVSILVAALINEAGEQYAIATTERALPN